MLEKEGSTSTPSRTIRCHKSFIETPNFFGGFATTSPSLRSLTFACLQAMTHARLSRLVGKPAAMAKGHVMPSAPSSSAFSPLSSHPCPCMSTTAREACPCMSTTASGTTTSPSMSMYQLAARQRMRSYTSNSIDTLEDEEYDGGRGRRITERILPARCIQSEYWTTSRASRYPESSDA